MNEYERFMLEQNKIMSRWCILVHNTKSWTIVFGIGTKQERIPFWKLESSNVPNVFKGSSLTGQSIRAYLESRADIYYVL